MTTKTQHLAARMARWSAHHRKIAIFGWLAVVVALFAISIVSPTKSIVFETSGPGESGRADTILYEDFKQPAGESVLIQHPTLSATSPEFKAVVQSVVSGVSALDAVAKVESPFDADNIGSVSDGQALRTRRASRSPDRPAMRPTRSTRSSPAWQRSRRRTPTSTSGRSARAPGRRSKRRSSTI